MTTEQLKAKGRGAYEKALEVFAACSTGQEIVHVCGLNRYDIPSYDPYFIDIYLKTAL